ncbi:MFS transporter [Cohnella massiliensis]|uniref:MFS transporter n=1 Tax=Cohnella massiliensis TaxID=1816691 RepID=UPI001FECB68C|nr:MFS transporter [Cohnella massiliensis]
MEVSRPLEKKKPLLRRMTPAPAPDSERPLRKNRPFLWIMAGNTISVFGDCFNGIALSLWVLQTTGSAKLMAAVQICYMATTILFGTLAGTVADRVDRRKLMLLSDFLRAGIAAALAVCLFYLRAPFPVMLALVTLSAFSSLFQGPAFHASVTQLAGKERIQQATSAVHLTDNVARISGLALAGVAVAAFGGFAAMLFTSVTFFLSGICVLAAGAFSSAGSKTAERAPFFADWSGGFAFIRKDALIRSIVILNPLLILFFMSSLMLIQVVAVKDWKAGPIAFGLIEMCIPLGYMIGAGLILSFSSRLGRRGWWVMTGLVALGPVFVAISFMPAAPAALPLILAAGIMFAFCTMLTQIILRSEVELDMQGRIYGTMGAITNVAPTLGLAVTSALADEWGATRVLEAVGLCLLVSGVAAVWLLKPIRNYR